MTTQANFDRRISGERRMVRALVKAIFARGYTVGVHDGEQWAIRRSSKVEAILNETAATDMETIAVFESVEPTSKILGKFFLVWGNSGAELIADHSDNGLCNTLWAELESLRDRME